MFDYETTKIVPYSVEDLFSLVSDVGRYHEFVPWVSKSKVYQEKENQEGKTFLADLEICYGLLVSAYTSHVQCHKSLKTPQISATLVKGAFKHLKSLWTFEENKKNECEVSLSVTFEPSQPLLFKLVEPFFPAFIEKIMKSFEERAGALLKQRF